MMNNDTQSDMIILQPHDDDEQNNSISAFKDDSINLTLKKGLNAGGKNTAG